MHGHDAISIFRSIEEVLNEHNIDLKNCRGQSYDNASNMSGKYNGLQSIIASKTDNLAKYVPCFAHSTNLAGQSAVDVIPEAVAYFDIVQHIYVFFTVSTHRWTVLKTELSKEHTPSVKRAQNMTRWSANADAVKAVHMGRNGIITALKNIEVNGDEKTNTRLEAKGLLMKIERLQFALLTEIWNTVLQQFSKMNTLLQNPNLDLNSAVSILLALKTFLESLRENFDQYEEDAKIRSGLEDYQVSRKRVRSARMRREDGSAEDMEFSARDHYKTQVSTYIKHVNIDKFKQSYYLTMECS
jgi:hypothetical protein